MSDEGERRADDTPPKKWQFPAPLPGQVEEGQDEDGDGNEVGDEEPLDWVLLCSKPPAAADALVSRLEWDGIACEVEDAPDPDAEDVTHRVLVLAEDLDRAREILDRPLEQGRAEFDAEADEYERECQASAVDNWFCLRCNEQTLARLPLSPGLQKLRVGCLGVLLVPPLVLLIAWATVFETVDEALRPLPQYLPVAWAVLVSVLGTIILMAHRDKYCTKCGWNSRDAATDQPVGDAARGDGT